ncbi:MAG: MFS transporter [Candidatus Lokiarchaeota archaeon]|nr:MFS transporter [Candidatus Lokiarchaeota archaeon]
MGLSQNIKKMNHNVRLTFLFSVFQNFGAGIWSGNVLSAYIFFFSDESNTLLGWTSGVMGIAMTLVVLPAGYFADKFRRDIILKIAAIIGLVSLCVLIFWNTLIGIFISLGLWGLYQGFTRPSLEAILADSTISGNRSRLYSLLHLVRQLSGSIGPFINVILFLILGDTWDVSILKTVMIIGMIITMISVVSMFFYNDFHSLGDISESISQNANDNIKENTENQKRNWIIFGILISSSLIIGIGAGMTIKYFSIFFIEQYALQPVSVQLIMGMTSVATGLAAIIAQRISKRKGRIQMIFVFELVATICLFIIATYPNLWILIPLFIIRGSLMNAGEPLSRSILMDIVPKKHRGKVNSIQTISWGLLWNASAVLGGYLVGNVRPYNFRLNFLVTASVYVVGIIPLIFLFRFVGLEVKKERLTN